MWLLSFFLAFVLLWDSVHVKGKDLLDVVVWHVDWVFASEEYFVVDELFDWFDEVFYASTGVD